MRFIAAVPAVLRAADDTNVDNVLRLVRFASPLTARSELNLDGVAEVRLGLAALHNSEDFKIRQAESQ